LFHLVLESHDGRAPGADSEEKHEPVSDIDTVVVDSLKALDPEWPIREEKHEPVSDIDTVVVDSLKALDPEWPIREADINSAPRPPLPGGRRRGSSPAIDIRVGVIQRPRRITARGIPARASVLI
jgi:hypothetical protein